VRSSSPTCYLTQRDADKLKRLLTGKAADEDIKEALQRLNKLTQYEHENAVAQILGDISGEQTHSACNPTSIECPSLGVRGDISMFCRRQQGASLSD